MDRRKTGNEYEEEACDYMGKQGFILKERNYRCRQGEIDVIGFHEGYLVFVEVKFRKTVGSGYGEEAVTVEKQRRICRTAQVYMMSHGYDMFVPVRYDVITFLGNREGVFWYRDAFPHRQ